MKIRRAMRAVDIRPDGCAGEYFLVSIKEESLDRAQPDQRIIPEGVPIPRRVSMGATVVGAKIDSAIRTQRTKLRGIFAGLGAAADIFKLL